MTRRPSGRPRRDATPAVSGSDSEASVADFPSETAEQIAAAVRALRDVERIRPAVWETLDAPQRLAALQGVEDIMAAIQRRPKIPIIAQEMGSGEFGAFDGERVVVNVRHLLGDMPVEEIVDTIAHEGRHAYQQYAVENAGIVADESVTRAWAENLAHYLDAETYGQARYEGQPIERDAWSYAERIRRGLYEER